LLQASGDTPEAFFIDLGPCRKIGQIFVYKGEKKVYSSLFSLVRRVAVSPLRVADRGGRVQLLATLKREITTHAIAQKL
jgi:hypothetical protein